MRGFKIILVFIISGWSFVGFVFADTTTALRPIADGGNDSASWSNKAGTACNATNCYVEVYESSGGNCTNSDGDTSYIVGQVNGANQTFDLDITSVPDNATITGINISVCSKRGAPPANQTNNFQTRICVNGSCSNSGANIATQAGYTENTQSFSGLSIVKSTGSDIEIGVSITGNSTRNIRVSQISASINYVPGSGDTGGGGITPKPQKRVLFYGQAYPESNIEILRRDKRDLAGTYEPFPLARYEVVSDGTFYIEPAELTLEEYIFTLKAQDKDGRKSDLMAFDVDLRVVPFVEIKDFLVPPTLGFQKASVFKGKELNVLGFSAPKNKIEIVMDDTDVRSVNSGDDGFWSLGINTDVFALGMHTLKVRQIAFSPSTKESPFSSLRTFRVSSLEFPEADFNGDDKINITDWSIFLARWIDDKADLRSEIDLNNDDIINIVDFSLFLNKIKINL